ncbi:MAG: FIST C-terminal domain-containing protein [Proteobacteria bacterium]|nr:FIST C-terminal domain-containing protein [Pseudomonadota bacterium]
MKSEQLRWSNNDGWKKVGDLNLEGKADVVFVFGDRKSICQEENVKYLKEKYPHAHLFGCSTSGEICNTEVTDNCIVATAVCFEKTQVRKETVTVAGKDNSFDAGEKLASQLDQAGLKHVFVLSEGLGINGSELVKGISKHLPEGVTVTGGLAGDGTSFEQTCILDTIKSASNAVTALAFYGESIQVSYASLGGWDSFGPERVVTRSEGNVLYELDGKSALEIYKSYLGEQAKGLPATGLLFPLSIRTKDNDTAIVRTILAVDEATQSITFAGDIPEGCYARLMKANFDRLVDGAIGAANVVAEPFDKNQIDLALLVSCVGRKLVLGQRVEEEVEGVREILGPNTVMTGFYSYGEISPFTANAKCELHNQTMTITAFSEKK